MPLNLTNVTASLVNVPCNGGSKPKYGSVVPGATVTVSDEYLSELNTEATARLESICQGESPIFKVEVVKTVAAFKPPKSKKTADPEPELTP